MIPKLLYLLGLLSLLMQGQDASSIPVVETIPEITFTYGEEGLLKCAYERKPYAVFWGFRSGSSSSDLLLVKHRLYPVGKRSGPGYDEGRFNITDDYSLLIHNVSVEDEGRYICNVADLKMRQIFRNYTNVAVIVQAVRPLVRVHQCGSNYRVYVNATDKRNTSCVIHATPDQHHVQLDCFVEGAKPQVDMLWINNNNTQDSLNGTSSITHGKREGTVDQKLTVILEVSEFQSEREYYFTCIAEGQAVGGIASVTIGINNVLPGVPTSVIPTSTVSSSVVVVVVVVVTVVVVLISVLFWKKYSGPQHRSDDDIQMDIETRTPSNDDRQTDVETRTLLNYFQVLLDKRKTILNYSANGPTTKNEDTDHINLGVFGLTKALRSSLISSLIFSFKGIYPTEADSRGTQSRERDSTRQIEEIELTNHLHLLNYKGMLKSDWTNQNEISYQIKGQPIQITTKLPIHCAIFVCDYRNRKGRSREFMNLLSKDVRRYFGRGIMLVIPNKGDLDGNDDTIKAEMSHTFGIPENQVWIFENYTLKNHHEDVKRSIEFLNFISHCLTVLQENKQLREDRWCNVM